MAKGLEDFAIKINMNGWFIRGHATLNVDQVLTGNSIHKRMIAALKNKETFGKAKIPVCELIKGELPDLEKAFAAAGKDAGSVRPAAIHEPVVNAEDGPGPMIAKESATVIEPVLVESELKPEPELKKEEKPLESDTEFKTKPVVKKAVKKTK